VEERNGRGWRGVEKGFASITLILNVATKMTIKEEIPAVVATAAAGEEEE